jgi:hypothetical protein
MKLTSEPAYMADTLAAAVVAAGDAAAGLPLRAIVAAAASVNAPHPTAVHATNPLDLIFLTACPFN